MDFIPSVLDSRKGHPPVGENIRPFCSFHRFSKGAEHLFPLSHNPKGNKVGRLS